MRLFISFILILVFVDATSCLPLAAMAVDPLVFGLTLGLTGKYEKASAIQEQGYQLWVRDVNQRGGFHGPGTLEFVQAFQEMYGREPAYFAATAYAAGQIMEKAIAKAKSVNRERINRILFSLDTMSVIGRFGVDRTGKQIKNFTLVTQARNGTIEVVWPQSLKTDEPVFE